MNLREILKPESVLLSLSGTSKEEIIGKLVDALPLSPDGATVRQEVLRAVLERERVMSTGIGRGVAIPHAKTSQVEGLMAAVGIAEAPIPFDSIDGKPVKIFFLIVSDPKTTSPHIRALSQISRVLNDRSHKTALEQAGTVEEVLQALEFPED
jgi:PTS system fructose-specific IIA component